MFKYCYKNSIIVLLNSPEVLSVIIWRGVINVHLVTLLFKHIVWLVTTVNQQGAIELQTHWLEEKC